MRHLGVVSALVACAGAGCAARRVYLNRDVATAVVLIPFNESNDIEAPVNMWKYVEHHVAGKGYLLVPRDVVEKFYADHKFTADPGEIKLFSTQELAQKFGVDAVVYSNIERWGKKTVGIYTEVGVTLHAEMYDRDGNMIWGPGKGESEAAKTADLGSGWKGLLRSAARDTAAAAVTDVEEFAPGAAAGCFASLPWAGWDPEVLRQREAEQAAPEKAPGP